MSGMRACRVLMLVLACGSLPACAWLFHKPRPDADVPASERPWRVRCSWVIPATGAPGDPPGPRDSGWAWATDAMGRRLVVDGRLEDGFLSVDGLRAESDDDDRDVVTVPLSAGTLADACAIAARHAREDADPVVYAIAAAREGEGVPVTMAFPFDPNGPPVTRVVIFGDSLSDPGNLKDRLMVFPLSPYWLGRFSNGPNWADWFARNTGLAVQNHAFGGAVAVSHPEVPAADIIAAIQQHGQLLLTGSVETYVNDYLARDLENGTVQRPWDTVFVIWAGANDYLSKEPFTGDIGTLLDTPSRAAGYTRVADETVAALGGQIRRLYAAGARRFMVVTLPDLGRTPAVWHNESYQPADVDDDNARRALLSRKLSELTAYHNAGVEREVVALRPELPGARIVVVEATPIIARMLGGQPPDGGRGRFDYGFELEPLERDLPASPHSILLQDRCYNGGYLGTSDPNNVCRNASRALFWDSVHPTTFTHCWIAWFIQAQMARDGFLGPAPTAAANRRVCEGGSW